VEILEVLPDHVLVVHRHQHVACLDLQNRIVRITVVQEEITMVQVELLWLRRKLLWFGRSYYGS
jgi:hypothetical protein